MPFGMSHANRHDDVASHYGRFVSYGIAPRGLLYRLQLVVLRRALSARYDHRSDGSPHSHHIGGKTLPWPPAASYTAGVGLVLYGALMIASPQPTTQNNGSAPMPSEMQMKMPGR